jgi:hypothetical protein
MLGGVRTANSTGTPLAARSAATSVAELPDPIKRVGRPAYGPGRRYSEVWITGGRKLSRPVQGGMCGSVQAPVASTTRLASSSPWDVLNTQP